jgi:MOSC domain-containing protein YiiM
MTETPFVSSEAETRCVAEQVGAAPIDFARDERSSGLAGTLLGIARHPFPRKPMETLEAVDVTVREGVHGDFRGSLKPGRNKRQVTVMAIEGWRDALAELNTFVPWEQRRVNLLVEGMALEGINGARIIFSCGLVLEVTGECDPCSRMEEIAPGLKGVLLPHWRGGVTTRVIEEGRLSVGDTIRIEL